MNTGAKAQLDKLIAELEQRVARLKAVRDALQDETIAGDIAMVFQGVVPEKTPVVVHPRRREGGTTKKLRTFFAAHGNQWSTVMELVTATRISKHSIRQVLYKTAPDKFERNSHIGGRRESKFRLRAPQGTPQDSSADEGES